MSALKVLLVVAFVFASTDGLDNGLARKPPMGFNSWARYVCNVDCEKFPRECISENLYKRIADQMVLGGYLDAGYEFVNIDDCWSEMERDPTTRRLVGDQNRFPSGIEALADYVHAKGLKLGIYTDVGIKTCAGYPALRAQNGPNMSADYFDIDAQTFADWGIDLVKVDGCFADPDTDFQLSFPAFEQALNATGRPIVYSSEWPLYMSGNQNYTAIAAVSNMWRNHDDVEDSWQSITSIIDNYGDNYDLYSQHQTNGAWNDPDMLVIGNNGLSYEQSRAQMAFWALFSAPLFLSTELEDISPENHAIVTNRDIIAVDQDALGAFGKRLWATYNFHGDFLEVWTKPLSTVNGKRRAAVIFWNRTPLGGRMFMTYWVNKLIDGERFEAFDLYDNSKSLGTFRSNQNLTLLVNSSGSVRFIKLVEL